MSPVKEARKIDDLTVEFETNVPDPIFLQEQTNLLIMSKAWCEAHNSAEPVTIGRGATTSSGPTSRRTPTMGGSRRAKDPASASSCPDALSASSRPRLATTRWRTRPPSR